MKSNQDPRTIHFEADPDIQKPDQKTNAVNSLSVQPLGDKVKESSNEESKKDQKTQNVRSKKRALIDDDEEEVKGDQPKKQQLSHLELLRQKLKEIP